MVSVNLASSYLTFYPSTLVQRWKKAGEGLTSRPKLPRRNRRALKATAQAHPSSKRKPSEKVDRPPKKPKVVAEPTVGETAATGKLLPKPGKGKGLMMG